MSDRPEEFFKRALDFFSAQTAHRKLSHREYEIAGRGCRLEIIGDELANGLTRALDHLPSPALSPPDLTIYAWDGEMVSPAWTEADYGPRGLICGFNTERFVTAFDHGTGALNLFDRESGTAIFWTRRAHRLPAHETAAPFRTIFGWWMEGTDRALIHGAAVATENGGILLAGAGGSGKSTTALLCLAAGWKFLGDDYCAIRDGDPPRLFSLYRSAKVSHEWLRQIPAIDMISETPSLAHQDKQLLFLKKSISNQLAPSAPCRACLLPTIVGGPATEITAATNGEALRALAPASIFQSAVSGSPTVELLSSVIRKVPVGRLHLGSKLDQIPAQLSLYLNAQPS